MRSKRERAQRVLSGLRTLYPDARTELDFATHFPRLAARTKPAGIMKTIGVAETRQPFSGRTATRMELVARPSA